MARASTDGDILGLDVRYVQKSIYALDPTFGQFDLVICGSLLLHLGDIFGAIERIRSVCQGEAIIATAAMDDHKFDDKPFCEFVGSRTLDGPSHYWTFWRLNAIALKKMVLAAGFSEASEVGQFVLESEAGKEGFAIAAYRREGNGLAACRKTLWLIPRG